ncbi:MAG: HAD-IA family hydrolase [Candidatus Saccharibacteria bacterium]|nr:HAD-IA family hydrolase [Candidatus Saccharibacteria bacterium]
MLKTYVFDFDGTLADTLQLSMDLFNELSVQYKFSAVKEENINILQDRGARGFLSSLNINPTQAKEVVNLIKHKESDLIDDVDVFPDLKDVLIELKNKGFALGILTSNTEKNVHSFLEKNNLNFFDFVISENDLFGKDIVLKQILEERKLLPEETVYIGDEDRDIEAAKKAGLKSIAVTWGFNSEKLLQSTQPNYVINSPKELLEIK